MFCRSLTKSWSARQSGRSVDPFSCKPAYLIGSNVYDIDDGRIHHWNAGECVHWTGKLLWLDQEPQSHLHQLYPDLFGSFQNELPACGICWCNYIGTSASCLWFFQSSKMLWYIMDHDWPTIYMVCHLPQHLLLPQNCPFLPSPFPLVEGENGKHYCCFSCIFFVLTDFLFSTAWNTSYFQGDLHDG